jgi:hypothetical protein
MGMNHGRNKLGQTQSMRDSIYDTLQSRQIAYIHAIFQAGAYVTNEFSDNFTSGASLSDDTNLFKVLSFL